MTLHRLRGSFLVICMVMVTLIVILSFAALHSIASEVDVSTSNQRYLLAEATAQSGLDHAIENILIDYGTSTYNLTKYAAPRWVTVPAITMLDGQFRAPFTAINYPNSMGSSVDTNNPATCDNDVRLEDYVLRPWAWWWFDVDGQYGWLEYDGKGRYYEPGYYNNQFLGAGAAAPVTATPFLNLSAALPQRSQGMFYDEQYRRIAPSNGPVADRANARYRLRYTVGVEDLQGHLLINPIPDMQMLTTGPGGVVDYRNPATNYPWMPAATNALAVMAGSVYGPSGSFASQLEHVFQGRGYHTNIDLDHTNYGVNNNGTGGSAGYPKTFPLEYRNHPDPVGSGSWESFLDGASEVSNASAGRQPYHVTNQLYYSSNGQVKGLAQGGETIPANGTSLASGYDAWPYYDGTYMHCLVGPQLSFEETTYAAHGETAYLGGEGGGGSRSFDDFALTPFGRVMQAANYIPGHRKWYEGKVTTPFYLNVMTVPPNITNCMLQGYLPPQNKITAFDSVVWQIWLRTDPVYGNIYQTVGTDNLLPQLINNQGTGYGRDLLCSSTSPPAFWQWPPPSRSDANIPGAQNPPGATGINQVISPDYYADDTRLSVFPPATTANPPWPYTVTPLPAPYNQNGPAAWPYPGPFMEGNSANTGQGSDNLGASMDETAPVQGGSLIGVDLNTRQPFCSAPNAGQGTYWDYYSDNTPRDPIMLAKVAIWATVVPPAAWGYNPQDQAYKGASTASYRGSSYFLDLIEGMGMALTVLRAQYTQYGYPDWVSTAHFFGPGKPPPPHVARPPSDPNPALYTTLRDLDRLFLAEMGESMTTPGTASPGSLYDAGNLTAYRYLGYGNYPNYLFSSDYIPKNNIWSLVNTNPATGTLGWLANNDNSVTSKQRAHVMELLLNDFRMSFLGSSPDYADGIDPTTGLPNPALQFMPLDFLGDGMTYCSCYTQPNEVDKDWLPCAPDGTPPQTYFTITGNLFMGKSHFYRIFSRGEVWDNILNSKLDNATVDSVLAVDPEGNDPLQTQMLYQRWVYNRYDGMAPSVRR